MRRFALAFALIALAGPAVGQDKAPKAPDGLRGPAPARSSQVLAALAPPPAPGTPTSPSLAQCALDCSRTYYFCLADEGPGTCGATWAQCRAGCSVGRDPLRRPDE